MSGSRPARSRPRPERWALDAGDAEVATLTVPADALRERRFEVSCAMSVRVAPGATEAWHRMTVLADGARQWQRRVVTSLLDGSDGLDHRFERSVPPGQALRITVELAGQGVQRRRLVIEADEQAD
jgi:hypothetical protein